jgi:ABC-type cobalamin/Fe3+-siderophores transport systems, ATPase components
MRLDISNAAYSYDEEGDNVFENITFSVGEGDIFCVLGPNGTGSQH